MNKIVAVLAGIVLAVVAGSIYVFSGLDGVIREGLVAETAALFGAPATIERIDARIVDDRVDLHGVRIPGPSDAADPLIEIATIAAPLDPGAGPGLTLATVSVAGLVIRTAAATGPPLAALRARVGAAAIPATPGGTASGRLRIDRIHIPDARLRLPDGTLRNLAPIVLDRPGGATGLPLRDLIVALLDALDRAALNVLR